MKKLTISCIIITAMILLCSVLSGCESQWFAEQRPETAEERRAVSDHETMLLSNVPATLSGHDQDWDDVVETVHKIAVKTHCKTRLYEYYGGYTGKMKEVNEVNKTKE